MADYSDLPHISEAAGTLNPNEELEWLLIASAILSYPVFQLLKIHICPAIQAPPPKNGTSVPATATLFRRDFVNPAYNELWPAVHRYWNTLAGPTMEPRRLRPVPQLWERVLIPTGSHRDPTTLERLWGLLAPFLDLDEAPLDMDALRARMQSTQFLTWRTMAVTRSGSQQILQNLHADRIYNPQDLLSVAKEIKAAGLPFDEPFATKLTQIMQGHMDAYVRPVPFGLGHLDNDLCGGLPAGSVALVAGFTGSGKTVAAVQMGLSAVRNDIPTLLITTEISTRAYITRLVSNGLSFDYGLLLKHQMEAGKPGPGGISTGPKRFFPPAITNDPVRNQELSNLQHRMDKYLRIEDWSISPNTTVEDSLDALLEIYMDNGFRPQYVLFDWLSPSTIKVGRNQQDWMGYEKAAEAFVRSMKRFNLTGVLFAQLAECPNAGKMPNPNHNHLAHSKKMSNFMPIFITISRMEEKTLASSLSPGMNSQAASTYARRQYWNVVKARDFQPKLYPVEAKFINQRVEVWK